MSIELDNKQGLIAGNGQLPVMLSKNAKENGFEIVAISLFISTSKIFYLLNFTYI